MKEARNQPWEIKNFDSYNLRYYLTHFDPAGWLGEGAKQSDSIRFLEETLKMHRYAINDNEPAYPQISRLGQIHPQLRKQLRPISVNSAEYAIGRALGVDIRQAALLRWPDGNGNVRLRRKKDNLSITVEFDGNRIKATYRFGKASYSNGVLSVIHFTLPATLTKGIIGKPISRVIEFPDGFDCINDATILNIKQAANKVAFEIDPSADIGFFQCRAKPYTPGALANPDISG